MNPLACWQDLTWAVVDFETTGYSATYDAIVEAAVVRMHHGHVLDRWSTLVNPGRSIPRGAQDVHGITGFDVHRAPTFVSALPALLHRLHGAIPVAYGAEFDRRMLLAEAERVQLDDLPFLALDRVLPWIDPLYWARALDRFDKKSRGNKLHEACARWGVPLVEAHRALHDAEAAGALLWKMSPYIGRMTVSELLRRQRLRSDGRRDENPSAS